ncbi:MAG TPA: PAS domain-containing protein [Burkholderiaceae bacterium]|nr:PAS domain-containing protein [Burkholderiaceae bacterium]
MSKPELSFEEIQAVLENASIGIAFTRDRVFRLCNQRSAEIFGFASPADVIGKSAASSTPTPRVTRAWARKPGRFWLRGNRFKPTGCSAGRTAARCGATFMRRPWIRGIPIGARCGSSRTSPSAGVSAGGTKRIRDGLGNTARDVRREVAVAEGWGIP